VKSSALKRELEQEKRRYRVEMPERESVQNLERARERITELREQVRELKLRVAELEGERSDLPTTKHLIELKKPEIVK